MYVYISYSIEKSNFWYAKFLIIVIFILNDLWPKILKIYIHTGRNVLKKIT